MKCPHQATEAPSRGALSAPLKILRRARSTAIPVVISAPPCTTGICLRARPSGRSGTKVEVPLAAAPHEFAPAHVRLTPQKADMDQQGCDVRFVPILFSNSGPVLSAVGTCPPHDGVRRRWWINVASAVSSSRARKKSDDLTTAIVLARDVFPACAGTENLMFVTRQPPCLTK